MQNIRLVSAVLLAFAAGLFTVAFGQQPSTPGPFGYPAGRIERAKLLTPDVGWAATRSHLFWTTDAGRQWTDVTPKLATPEERISAVFFLDRSTGWALLVGGSNDNDEGQPRFDFASTSDAGEHWTVRRVKIPGMGIATLSGAGDIYFLDRDHGWISLRVLGNTTVHRGGVLVTEDGGTSWKWMHDDPGLGGEVFFNTLNDGWTIGQDLTEIYATHDGSKSWQELKLQAPPMPHAGTGEAYVYSLPRFEDGKHGFLMAAFADSDRMVLFTTADGGLTWKANRVLPHSEESKITISHSSWTAVSIPLHGNMLTLTRIPLGDVASQSASAHADISHMTGIHALGGSDEYLEFADDSHGWVLAGELLSTSDGGATWIDVTPAGARPTTSAASPQSSAPSSGIEKPKPRRSARAYTAKPPGVSLGIQTAMGFDMSQVQPAKYMSAWVNSAPYLVTSLYLPSQNHTTDPNLNANWVTAILKQGWALIPIWTGLQPPCACYHGVGTYPGCKLYTYLIPTDGTAMNQGELDAKAAEQAAANLGAGAAIIYKDLENYSPASVLPTGSTCGSVVNAYLSGWDTQLHSDQYSAGAYSNPTPAANWAATGNVSPLPDDVWIAQANNQITTWNVGTKYGMTDSMWPDYQRIHQYTGTHSEAWGGTPSFSIDSDIVNAEVFSNTEIPNYAYTPTNIDCPGAIETIPVGINDMSNGALINGPGQMGTVVGFFQSSLGSPTYGFQNTAGSCTTISFPGSSYTEATGINNLGQIVGYFEDSTGAYHGFLLNPGKSPVKIDYTGGGQTYLYGINDAGQIVGWAYNSGTFLYQTFMYYGGQFYPLGFTSNFEYTLGFGINGDATLTGLYYYEPDMEDFELSTLPSGTPPTWTGNVVGLTPGGTANTIAKGINANNEMAGYYYSSECMNTVGQCGFTWSGGTSLDILSYGADANVASGINNLGEVVGPYNDSATQYSHGLIWTHP